jgi:hypothetical protein
LPSIPAAALLAADYLYQAKAIHRALVALHALLCAFLLVAALLAPFAMVKVPPPAAMQFGMIITGCVIALMVLLMVRREGLRVLHFVTLVPTILAMAFLLRPAAPVIDRAASARSVQARLKELGYGEGPLAVFHVRRDVAYGLNFYRNQGVVYYEADAPADMPREKPSGKHVLVVQYHEKAASKAEQEKKQVLDQVGEMVSPRIVASIGDFPAQRLEFFLVGPAREAPAK